MHGVPIPGFRAENPLERRVLADRELAAGLAWGVPRAGHPEGSVGHHVAAMLASIAADDPLRADLRLLALLHDSFKRAVRPEQPWSYDNDHAVLARRFAERYIADERLLAAIELHDEPYWLWHTHAGGEALVHVIARIPDRELFVRFVELDASSEGKNLTFLWWFRRELAGRGLLPPRTIEVPLDGAQPPDEVRYVKTFAVETQQQAAVAQAARALIAEHADRLAATGDVHVSEDGLRVMVVWHWRGSTTARLLRDGEVVREALAAHPILGVAEALEARLFLPSPPIGSGQ
jgi:hypothetical protein